MTETTLYYDGDPVLMSTEYGMMRRRKDLEEKILSEDGLELWEKRNFIIKTLHQRVTIWEYFITWKVKGDSAHADR